MAGVVLHQADYEEDRGAERADDGEVCVPSKMSPSDVPLPGSVLVMVATVDRLSPPGPTLRSMDHNYLTTGTPAEHPTPQRVMDWIAECQTCGWRGQVWPTKEAADEEAQGHAVSNSA